MTDEVAAPSAEAAVNPLEQLVERYIQLRDKKAEIESEAKKKVAKLNEAMTRIENYLLKHLQDNGAESVRTGAGTFFTSMRTSATVADWDHLLGWIREGEHWSALEKRVSKSFVESFKEEHNDLPPGIDFRQEKVVNVRRS